MHLNPDIVRAFLRVELGNEENREVVRHLSFGCPECWSILRQTCESEFGQGDSELPKGALLSLAEVVTCLQRQRREAPRLVEKLEQLSPAHQVLQVRNNPRFQTATVCEALIEMSWERRYDDAQAALNWAQLALLVTDHLDPHHYGSTQINDLKAKAWAYVANTERILSQFPTAEISLREAESYYRQGSGDPLIKAQVLAAKANLFLSQERIEEAVELLDRVLTLRQSLGDQHAVGVAMVDKGVACGCLGEYDEAIALLRQGLERLDPERDPLTYLNVRHNLAYFLHDSGRLAEAVEELEQVLPLFEERGDRLAVARCRWLEGRIALSCNQISIAEDALLEARDEFVVQELGLDAAEISLELAVVYARRRWVPELRRLAAQMMPIFQTLELPAQATAALAIFAKATKAEHASVSLIENVLAYLQRVRENPDIEFPDAKAFL